MSKKNYSNGLYGQLHYRQSLANIDTNESLFCFHMSPYSSFVYENFLSETATIHKSVVAIDTPGFGNSDPTLQPPTIEDYADAMIHFAEDLKIKSLNIMGYHTGSKIALEVANKKPELINKVILISAPIFNQEEVNDFKSHYLNKDKILKSDGSHLQDAWNEVLHWSMKGRSIEHISETFHARLINPKISWWGHNAAFNYNSAEAISKIDSPMLILNPGDDLYELTPRAQKYLQHPQSRIMDLKDWSHGFLDVKTSEAASIIFQFLDN